MKYRDKHENWLSQEGGMVMVVVIEQNSFSSKLYYSENLATPGCIPLYQQQGKGDFVLELKETVVERGVQAIVAFAMEFWYSSAQLSSGTE
jgi:hypothetical protein